MRMAQTFGLAFLFAPISAVTYASLPNEKNGDAAALFTMFRNVAGSIGISVATALVTQRTQVQMAHLSTYMTPLYQPFADALQSRAQELIALGHAPAAATQVATGMMYQTFVQQAQVLAYSDVFRFCAVMAACAAPCALLFTAKKASGGAPPH
jgi:DHA2 family multidrug resistance protein